MSIHVPSECTLISNLRGKALRSLVAEHVFSKPSLVNLKPGPKITIPP